MALITHDGTDWIFKHGKHIGKTLDEVAKETPTYLQWMFSKASDDLTDEAFHALEDAMEENDIDVP